MSLPPPQDNYVGEPEYPAPWTTKQPREGLRDTDQARIICLAPDVCLTPVGSSVVPIPYSIVDYCGHDQGYTPSVRFTGQKAMVLRSNTTHVHGDAPGTRKGVKSGTVEDICEPIGHAAEVRAEGSNVIRHLDRFWMNSRNTVGEAIFVRDTGTYPAPEDDDPVPGSLRMTDRSSDGQVMSDATPEPLIMGAQYAQALPAQPLPEAPRPAPRPPGQVIRPNVPQWNRPPPTPAPPIGKWLGRLGRFGRAVSGVGAFIAGMWPTSTAMPWYDELPQDAFEEALFAKARELEEQGVDVDAVNEWFQNERAVNARRRAEQEERQAPAPLPETDNARVDEDEDWPCLVGPYDEIRPICPGEAHHIVPDMALRYGNRAEGMSGLNRIPNAPTFGQGMTVCLTGGMHGGLHTSLNTTLGAIGTTYTPSGTAPILRILRASQTSIDAIVGLPEECKERAKAAARAQMFPLVAQPGRTTMALPSPEAREVLARGYY